MFIDSAAVSLPPECHHRMALSEPRGFSQQRACAQTSTNAQGKPAATRPTPAAPSSQAAPAAVTFTLRAVSIMGDFLGLAEATERYAAEDLRLHCLGDFRQLVHAGERVLS